VSIPQPIRDLGRVVSSRSGVWGGAQPKLNSVYFNHKVWFVVTIFTATCFSNVAVMGSLDVRLSVCLSVRDVGEQ